MQRQLHDIADAKGQHVPEVHSSRMRLESKGYRSYRSSLQKIIGLVRRQPDDQRPSIFIPSRIFGNNVMRMRYTSGYNVWLPMRVNLCMLSV